MVAGDEAGGAAVTSRPRVLVTRPSADAIPLAGELQRRGFDVLLQPLLRIELEDGPPPDLTGVQALLFTSANGVRAFVSRSDVRTVSVYAVGDATAAAATADRFLSVESAGGTVEDLADLVRKRLDPAGGRLLHVAGSNVAGDLSGALEGAGFTVERTVLYSARKIETLDPSIHSAIAAGEVDAALFFSPRSAASFVSLVRDAALGGDCGNIRVFGLSDAVLKALSPVSWRAVYCAPEPTQDSMLAILEREVTDTDQPDSPRPENAKPTPTDDLLSNGDAGTVVDRFGGIRPMASKLGIPVTTVQGWRARGHIPENRIDEIRSAAAEHGVDLAPGAGDEASGGDTESLPPAQNIAKPETTGKVMQDETPSTPPPPTAPQSGGGSGTGVAWAALILAVIALAGVASYRYWGQFVGEKPQASAALLARIDKLESEAAEASSLRPRIDQVTRRLETLSMQVASLPAEGKSDTKALTAMTAEMESLRSLLDALARKMNESESRAGAAFKDQIAALRDQVGTIRDSVTGVETRLKAIEDRPPATGGKIAALAVAAGQLDSAIDSGRPFGDALASLKALAAGDVEIEKSLEPLENAAKVGVPTVASLTRQFQEIAPKLMVPAAEQESGGWTETLRRKALSLVNMRPVGDAGGKSPVTRAERALAGNDLVAAVAALEGVPGLAVSWRDRAQGRLDADASIATVRARIVDRLATESQQGRTAGADTSGKP